MATTFDIGRNVRRLRQERGISLSALARQAGISKAYLSQMENDPTKRPSVAIVYQLAQALDVGFDEVIGLEDPAAGKETGGTAAAPAPAGSPPAAPGIGAPTAADAALADATPGTPPGDLTAAFDPGSFPSGLRIFWHEHPELPLEEVRLLAAVAQHIDSLPLTATDYWLLYETIRLIRRRFQHHRSAAR